MRFIIKYIIQLISLNKNSSSNKFLEIYVSEIKLIYTLFSKLNKILINILKIFSIIKTKFNLKLFKTIIFIQIY